MRKNLFRVGAVTVLSLLFLSCLLPVAVVIQGCSSANRTAYVGETGLRVTVETGMGMFNQLVKAGKVTQAQELVVKHAYEKLQATAILLCDAGKVGAAAASTNGVAISSALTTLSANYQQGFADLQAALLKFNINL